MDIDYLEEIKIETRPRSRRERSGQNSLPDRTRGGRKAHISLESVRDKKLLIEGLRQKEQEESLDLGLSLSNIELLKKHMQEERKNRPSALIAETPGAAGPAVLPEAAAVEQPVSVPDTSEVAEQPLVTTGTPEDATQPLVVPGASEAAEQPHAVPSASVAQPIAPGMDSSEPVVVPVQPDKKTAKLSPAIEKKRKRKPVRQRPERQPGRMSVWNKSLGNRVLLRYLIKELFLYFAICFAFFFVVFFVNQILLMAETVLRQRVPVHNVIRLMLYSLPAIIAQSAPFATLVGFLMCVGRMATDNEILIMRASGLRYSFIALPVVLMGLLISCAGFAMNDYFLPLGILKYNRLRKQIIQSDPAVEIEANSVKRMNGTTLVIGGVNEDGSIGDLVIFDKDSTNRDRVIITGRSEVAKSDEPGILMQFNMSGSTVLEVDRTRKGNFDVFESQRILLNVFDSVLLPNEGIQPREMTSFDLWKIIQIMKKDTTVTHKMMNRYNLEFAKKFSLPFGSIFFAILAFPLALIFGKRDGQTLGMIFGIIISVIYWAATILGQMFGVRSGWNGFWMMWGPNFFIGLVGLLIYAALRKK